MNGETTTTFPKVSAFQKSYRAALRCRKKSMTKDARIAAVTELRVGLAQLLNHAFGFKMEIHDEVKGGGSAHSSHGPVARAQPGQEAGARRG